MKKRFLLRFVSLIILITACQDSIGQTLKIVPPVPNAMKMTEYNTQRPNMYTGTASVTIPLYAIDFDGWQLPLSISYNATGIRTGEEASEVGLGWALNSTGVISRTVRGGDDFFKGTLNGNGVGRGYAYNRVPIPEPFDLGYDQFTMTTPPPTSYYAYLAGSRPNGGFVRRVPGAVSCRVGQVLFGTAIGTDPPIRIINRFFRYFPRQRRQSFDRSAAFDEAVRSSHRGRRHQLHRAARGDSRVPRAQRRRQDDDDARAHRLYAAHRREGDCCRL